MHVIYHIVGRKVGCSQNIERRMKTYEEKEGERPIYEVLEELNGVSNQEAGDREWWWADKFGYKRGVHYAVIRTAAIERSRRGTELSTPEQKTLAGKNGGRRRAEILSGERISEIAREAGKRSIETRTPEYRSATGRHAGLVTLERGTGIHGLSSDQRREYGRLGGRTGGAARLRRSGAYKMGRCSHCGYESTVLSLGRWHNDNCPRRPRFVRDLHT